MKTHTEETRLTLLSHTPASHTRTHHAGPRPSESEGNQDQDPVSGTGWGGGGGLRGRGPLLVSPQDHRGDGLRPPTLPGRTGRAQKDTIFDRVQLELQPRLLGGFVDSELGKQACSHQDSVTVVMRRVWVKEVGWGEGGGAPTGLEPTWSTLIHLFLSPSPGTSEVTFQHLRLVCAGTRWVDGWTGGHVHPSTGVSQLGFLLGLFGFFLSVLHLTVQMWESVDGGGGGGGDGDGDRDGGRGRFIP